ncbi:hypothetical protein DKG34_35985 [Streptomyces sp. NWU49]|uniref:hypothetical protein n=1 Tax=Streptomyces sp. NWU49 TaxID=2201153 RepID=UPI000D67A0B6|nr:hypothetical protein [Streptomyces sp. NWU49]PWJ02881.1 hypothetical protein DKG34_35985 [Streptomyces sp. NWU49]
MSEPGRALPSCRSRARHRTGPHRLTRAVRHAGRLLCGSLAAGMATAATDLLLEPSARWWPALWPLPWWLTCASLLAWAVLRTREKAAQRPPDEEEDLRGAWDTAA